MRVLLLLPLLFIVGCASVTPPAQEEKLPVPAQIEGLSAQELETGECGVFFWRDSVPRTFVFFQKQGQSQARLFDQGAETIIETEQSTSNLELDARFEFSYNGGNYEAVFVKAVFGDALEGGRRLSGGTITTKKPDGWQEILPVSGVYVCR
ncbi:MAG: hypothetical protein JKY25_06995 [Robiginitomaculum sp.]|nr:hypothetical protein [Robiginitomaculum sp.]